MSLRKQVFENRWKTKGSKPTPAFDACGSDGYSSALGQGLKRHDIALTRAHAFVAKYARVTFQAPPGVCGHIALVLKVDAADEEPWEILTNVNGRENMSSAQRGVSHLRTDLSLIPFCTEGASRWGRNIVLCLRFCRIYLVMWSVQIIPRNCAVKERILANSPLKTKVSF